MKVNNLLLAQALYREVRRFVFYFTCTPCLGKINHKEANGVREFLDSAKKIVNVKSSYYRVIEDLAIIMEMHKNNMGEDPDYRSGLEDLIIDGLTLLQGHLEKLKEKENKYIQRKISPIKEKNRKEYMAHWLEDYQKRNNDNKVDNKKEDKYKGKKLDKVKERYLASIFWWIKNLKYYLKKCFYRVF